MKSGLRAAIVSIHPLGPGVDRDDRRAQPRLHRRAVGHGGSSPLRRPPGVARGALSAAAAVFVSAGSAVRSPRAPRRGSGPRAAAASRECAVKYLLLAGAALATLA